MDEIERINRQWREYQADKARKTDEAIRQQKAIQAEKLRLARLKEQNKDAELHP